MKNLRILGAAIALAAILPLAAPSTSLAQDRGPGPCTPPAGDAVGAAGPAMNAGQLMAGVGQCHRIGGWYPYPGAGGYANYGAGADAADAVPSNPYYGGPDY